MKQKQILKRVLGVVLAVVLCTSMVACSGGESKEGDAKDDKYLEQFEIVPDDGKPSWEYDQTDYDFTWFLNASWMTWPTNGADLVSKVIYEKTGCKIEIITPGDDSGNQLSTMISSGELADVVSVQAGSLMESQLADQGYVWSIDTLMEKFAPSMKSRYYEEQVDVYNWFKRGDGKLYGIPNLCYTDYYLEDVSLAPNGAILVREDWYIEVVEKTGEDMTTKESFLKGCDYINKKYPNAIPVQLDPFTATGNLSVTWLMQYFAVPFEQENGEYNYQYSDPKFREVISFLNSLFVNGYIDAANLTANADAVSRNIARGNVFVSMATPQNYNDSFINLYNNGTTYIPLVLKNDAGDAPVLQDLRGKGYLLSMITKNAKRPDKIIKVFDYLTSEEGQLLINFGVEGDTFVWDEKHEKVVWTDKYVKDYDNNNTTQYGFGLCNVLLNQSFYDKVAPVGTTAKEDYSIYISNLKRPLCPYSYDYTASFLLPDTTSDDYFSYVEKQENLNKIWGRFLPLMIGAASEKEALAKLDSTLDSMKANDLDFVVSFMSEGYKKAKDAAGVEKGWPTYQEGYEAPTTGANGDFSYWNDIKR